MVVLGCAEEGESFFFPFCSGRLGEEGTVPHGVGGHPGFLVFLFVCVRAKHSCRAAHGCAVLATASRCVEGYRTPDEAMGEVPTAANLNLYRGGNSCVRWHCDDEPLFGYCGESFGASALFIWKGKSCPDNEAHLCCLCHGDSLVMDGQCQDAFLHCTDPCLEQERINVAFRWIKQHDASCHLFSASVACCLPTCAQGSAVPVTGNVGNGVFLSFSCSSVPLCIWRVQALQVYPFCVQRLGHTGVPLAGHAHWTEVRGGIIFVTSGRIAGQLTKLPSIFMELDVIS